MHRITGHMIIPPSTVETVELSKVLRSQCLDNTQTAAD